MTKQKKKELEDFGARMYDPAIARWWSVDPMAEKFSFVTPFSAFNNNPIRFIDPDGREVIETDNSVTFTGSDISSIRYELLFNRNQDKDPPKEKTKLQSNTIKPPTLGIGITTDKPRLGFNLNTSNNCLSLAGDIEGGVGALQVGMLEYRGSLSINSKLGSFGNFRTGYTSITKLRGFLGKAGLAGNISSITVDYISMQNGEIGGGDLHTEQRVLSAQ